MLQLSALVGFLLFVIVLTIVFAPAASIFLAVPLIFVALIVVGYLYWGIRAQGGGDHSSGRTQGPGTN
ncbi:MAG TPA: hypothetical protein VGO97_04590 [Solirubrobacterales bacterium]|jgi:hypothetical protein|nr:hypothetical protein [Solirubrobacterales bacterium]